MQIKKAKPTTTEVSGLLNHPQKGYSAKMTNLLNFLISTTDIRIGSSIVDENISIDQHGKIVPNEEVKRSFVDRKMSGITFNAKEKSELDDKLSNLYHQRSQQSDIIRLKKYKEEKKVIARIKIEELTVDMDKLRADIKELDIKTEALKTAERLKLESTDFQIEEMRKELSLYTGCKIKVDLQTGSYSFPIPTGTAFYKEVCSTIGLPPDNLTIEKPVIKRMFTIIPDVLKAIRTAYRFVSADDLRPATTGVNIEIFNNKLLVIATDAHKLFKSREFDVSGPPGTYTYLLPFSLPKRLPKAVNDDFRLYELKNGDLSVFGVTFTPIDAKFPDWRVVMPEYNSGVVFERKEMMDCVKEVSVYSNKSTNQVCFDFNGQVKLSAQDVDFSFECIRMVSYISKSMDDLTIAFNAKFMIEALNAFKSHEITFMGVAPTKAGIITDGIDTVLLMPLMLNN